MFDFHDLEVYKKAKVQYREVLQILDKEVKNKTIKDQLSRAVTSILLNIAEGSGRFSNADKRNFYVIARGSVFECVALMEILLEQKVIVQHKFDTLYSNFEELSKMLFGLIKSLKS